jgi:transcriptional regulator with XRE-family HTH domain
MAKLINTKKSNRLMLGDAIRRERRRLGLTQRELAAMIHARPDSISRIERGHHQPSLARLEKIASSLQVAPFTLLAATGGAPSAQILALLQQIESLDPDAQTLVLDTLRLQISFLNRVECNR